MEHAEEFEGLPSPDHVNTVMEGFIDTVTGVEGYGLTEAQHYLHGVLYANGIVASHHYHGNEGVIDSIKNGLMKAWQYITDMVKKVYGFFFGESTKKEIRDVNEGLKDFDKSLEIQPTSDLTEAKQQIKAMVSNTQKIVNEAEAAVAQGPKEKMIIPTKVTVEELNRELDSLVEAFNGVKDSDAKPSPAEVKKASEDAHKSYNKVIDLSLETAHDTVTRLAEERVQKMKELFAELGSFDHPDFKVGGMVQSTEKFIKAMEQWPVVLKEFKSVKDGRRYISKTKSIMTALDHSYTDFQSSEKYFNKKLNEFKGLINQRNLEEAKRESLKASLQAAQKGINAVAEVTKTLRAFLRGCQFFIDRYTLQLSWHGL